MTDGNACNSDCMEIGNFKFVGVRTFFIAMILISAYVYLLGSGGPLGGLEGMVSFVLGFMFGSKGVSMANEAVVKMMNK